MGADRHAAGGSRRPVKSRFGVVSRGRGFTLIELLVVIGIIAVLAAIVIPVYARAQEKARQTTCIANMHTIATAIRMYQMDYGKFPPPYEPVSGYGGISALVIADYAETPKILRCPDDQSTLGDYMTTFATMETTILDQDGNPVTYTGPTILDDPANTLYGQPWDADPQARYYRNHYSSYNCICPAYNTTNPDSNGDGTADEPYQLYNAYGYDPLSTDGLSLLDPPASMGGKYPGLCNRWAPGSTIITHCPLHRPFFGGEAAWQDIVTRLGGNAELMKLAGYDWVGQPE